MSRKHKRAKKIRRQIKNYIVTFFLLVLLMEFLYSFFHVNIPFFGILIDILSFLGGTVIKIFFRELPPKVAAVSDRLTAELRENRREYHIWGLVIIDVLNRCLKAVGNLLSYGAMGSIMFGMFILSPVIASAHPYAACLDGIAYVSGVIRGYDEEGQDENQSENVAETEEEEEAVEESEVTYPSGNNMKEGTGNTRAVIQKVCAHFWLTQEVDKEKLNRAVNLVLYKDDKLMHQGDVGKAVRTSLSELSVCEPDYMDEIFPKADEEKDESALYIKESKFEEEIAKGESGGISDIPTSSLLDQVIEGREETVRLLQSHRMASALANNYLKYILEYQYQGKTDQECLYYSAMAILAGQLQLCYSKTAMERKDALDWLYARYYAMREMGLVEDERLDDIVDCLDKLRDDWDFIISLE